MRCSHLGRDLDCAVAKLAHAVVGDIANEQRPGSRRLRVPVPANHSFAFVQNCSCLRFKLGGRCVSQRIDKRRVANVLETAPIRI